MSYNPNCGRCRMLNHWGQCQLTACRYPVQESGVINGSAYVAKIVTNYDRIVHMTPEELARYYAKRIARCYGCEAMTEDDCFECQLDWLKQEADNE